MFSRAVSRPLALCRAVAAGRASSSGARRATRKALSFDGSPEPAMSSAAMRPAVLAGVDDYQHLAGVDLLPRCHAHLGDDAVG